MKAMSSNKRLFIMGNFKCIKIKFRKELDKELQNQELQRRIDQINK